MYIDTHIKLSLTSLLLCETTIEKTINAAIN